MFTLPGLDWEIHAYGLMMALALLLAWVVTLSLGRRDRLPPGRLGTAYVLGVGFGLMGARMAWLLQRPGTDGGAAELFVLRGNELAPFAGVIVMALVAGLYVMRRRIPVVAVYDVAAPGLAAAVMVERLGALLSGIGFGDYAPKLAWAIRFPVGSPAYLEHQRALAGLLGPDATQSLPVHPTQLYGLVLAGITLAVALWVRKHRRFSGQVFLVTCMTYLLLRALVEDWFRADAQPAMLGPLNGGQVGALVIAAAMGVVLWSRGRLAQARPELFRPWEGGRWSPPDQRPQPVSTAAASAETRQGSSTSGGTSRGSGKGKGKKGKGKKGKKGRRRR